VTAITVAKSDDEALELANDTEYTLIGALWTRDLMKAMDMGSRIRARTVSEPGSSETASRRRHARCERSHHSP
jgi:acyl-CoA reductase-like NAD-dependent aldehyde dehydrogenase